jgi:hypothetical protein
MMGRKTRFEVRRSKIEDDVLAEARISAKFAFIGNLSASLVYILGHGTLRFSCDNCVVGNRAERACLSIFSTTRQKGGLR